MIGRINIELLIIMEGDGLRKLVLPVTRGQCRYDSRIYRIFTVRLTVHALCGSVVVGKVGLHFQILERSNGRLRHCGEMIRLVLVLVMAVVQHHHKTVHDAFTSVLRVADCCSVRIDGRIRGKAMNHCHPE